MKKNYLPRGGFGPLVRNENLPSDVRIKNQLSPFENPRKKTSRVTLFLSAGRVGFSPHLPILGWGGGGVGGWGGSACGPRVPIAVPETRSTIQNPGPDPSRLDSAEPRGAQELVLYELVVHMGDLVT